MASNFTVKDNTDIIVGKLKNAVFDGSEKMAKIAVDAVQEKILYGYKDPHGKDGHTEIVMTGKLFDSIRGEVKRQSQNLVSVTVGTDVDYAGYVHNGTRKLKARRFITDAMSEIGGELEKAMKSSLKNG